MLPPNAFSPPLMVTTLSMDFSFLFMVATVQQICGPANAYLRRPADENIPTHQALHEEDSEPGADSSR
jgi:hypothetical protein